MSHKWLYNLLVAMLVIIMVAGCGGAPTETAAPTATAEIINPPVIKEDQPTSTPKPTPTPKPVEAVTTPEEPKEVTEEFSVNGVTMPFNRSEAIISDQVDFSIFDSFNPFIPNGEHYQNGVGQYVREYLWYTNYATGEIIPWLAEGWEYNDDYTELKIYIRKGVTWNDGEPFTAHDVAFTMNMAMNPEYDDLGGLPQSDAEFWNEVYAADDFTVVFDMKEPRPRQHLMLWCRIVSGTIIVPEHIWSEVDAHTFKNNPPVYTGPYKLSAVYPENKVYVWERNEDYWGKALGNFPEAKYAIYRTGPGAEQQLAEVKENNMDIFGLSYDNYVQNKADLPQINQVVYVDPCPRAAWFNTAKAPLDQPEFRRAMSMLMNREKWGENIWSPPSKPAQGLWADYRNLDKFINEDAKETWGTLEYNPDKALELLESIGYKQEGGKLIGPDGQQVVLAVTTPVGVGGNEYLMGQDFTEELKSIGIEATFEYVEGVFWDNVDMGEFDIGFWWFCGATVDPTELYGGYTCDRVTPLGERATNGNEMRYCNEEYDQTLLALQAVDPDDPAAQDLYMKMFDLWLQDPPGVPLIETYYSVSFNTTYWDNMPSNENLYTVPFNWWGQIEQVYFQVTPK
ncbi:MAG: ABC transporter substrate-binding protein [Anaerolineae bacterium]|nr:ABC transporter substrate-binding protein [Anaerolineae bacterium]